jgi:RHS repeat-associated protein
LDNVWSNYLAVLDGARLGGRHDQGRRFAGRDDHYEPYGHTTASVANEPSINELPVGYAGGLRVGSLVTYGKRWYDAAIGRFTQQNYLRFLGDPKKGNRYAYAACNPTNNIDSTGQDTAAALQCAGGVDEMAAGAAGILVGAFAEAPSAGTSKALVIGGVGFIGTRRSTAGACREVDD